MTERLIALPSAGRQLLAAIAATPAGEKLHIPRLRDALVSQADVLGALQRLVEAGKLDRATLRPPVKARKPVPDGWRRGQSADGEPSRPLFDALVAEGVRRGLSKQAVSLAVWGNKARIYRLLSSDTARRKTGDKIRAWIAARPSEDAGGGQAAPPAPAPVEAPVVVKVPAGVRNARPYCTQPHACTAPPRGMCKLCQPISLARHATARGKSLRQHAEQRIAAGKSAGSAPPGALRSTQIDVERQHAEQARLADPVEQAKVALQRTGRTVYALSVLGGPKDRFHVSGQRDPATGKLKELTPAAVIDLAEQVTGQSFRREG